MANSFPSSVKTFSPKANGQPIYASDINAPQDEITAIETILINGPLSIGNSTVNTTISANGTTLLVGANVVANTTAVSVSNSTVNTTITSNGLRVGSSLGLNATSVNALENRGGQLFFNGQRVGLVGEYPAVYGYTLGGWTGGVVSTADRTTFSSGTTAAFTGANLSQARRFLSGLSDGAIYGYALGGNSGTTVATADRITFSTSTTAAFTGANLSQARYNEASLSDGAVYGYALGGFTPASQVATADRITFSTSTTAAFTGANLSQAREDLTGLSDGAVYGYALGGNTGANPGFDAADRITFSTSTTAAFTGANLSQARYGLASISDGIVYGYALGGSTGGVVATADRITFSNSTTAAFTAANLSENRPWLTGLSDGAVYGYALGGWTGAAVATADRITFSTSTTAAFTGANLSQARYNLAGLADYAI